MNRTKHILQIRPILNIPVKKDSSITETFQNEVLRPILKLQHELICFIFINSLSIKKLNFNNKDDNQKISIINDSLKANHKLKSQLIQSITSLMTIDEFKHYHAHRSEYQKRITSMAIRRLIDGLIIK